MFHRFHQKGPYTPGESVALEGEELHHAAHVVRLRVGEEVELFDGRGLAARGRAVEVTKSRAVVEVVEMMEAARELPFRLALAAALIAPDRFELVLQKATELGVTTIIPVITERTETRIERVAGKQERWRRIILEATKQSGRAIIPMLEPAVKWQTASAAPGVHVLFDADNPSQSLPSSEIERAGATLHIGPEGGWSDGELSTARDRGFIFRRLGERRLRAETASLAAIVSITTHLGVLD